MSRKRKKAKIPMGYLCVCMLLFSMGCSTLNRQSVTQESDVSLVRELMEPVYTGQQGLIDTLGVTDHEVIQFQLKNQTAKRVEVPDPLPRLWSSEDLFFFRINDPGIPGHGLYYFDPQTFRLVNLPLDGEDPEASQAFVLFRALPNEGRWFYGEQGLDLFRLSFAYTSDGEIRFKGETRVRGISGDPFLPVYLREKETVFFLNRDGEGGARLMSVDADGENLKEHLLKGAGEISRIYSEDGKILVFESDKKGYQSLFSLNPDDGLVTEFTHVIDDAARENPYILTSRYAQGASTPVVVKLPETLDIREITSLVMAQNPRVSLQRALFAAALVEVGIATLPNYPSFYFELGTVSPAGFFSDKGGFVSQTLLDGLLGFMQPLFDIKRNTELGRAAALKAETAQNLLDNEINERVAEALGLYFEIAYLNEMDTILEELMVVYGRRGAHYETLKTVGDAYGVQLLAAEHIRVAGLSEQAYNRQQRTYLMRRLKHLCGLSLGTQITLARDDFNMDEAVFLDEGGLHDLAVLNHPQIRAVTSELKKAYFLESAGPAVRGILNASAEYEYTGRSSTDALTDNINLTLSGGVSTAHNKSARLHRQYWARIKESLRIRLGIVSGEVQLTLDESLLGFRAAKEDYRAKQVNTTYNLEKARLARLYESIDTLYAEVEQDPLEVNTAIQEYLFAVAGLAEVKKDLGIRYVNVWRETGRSRYLPEAMEGFTTQRVDRRRASLWLWETQSVIQTAQGRESFLRVAGKGSINRVYTYLYSDSRLLDDALLREQFTLFLNECTDAGIEVWALLGEPEWLTGSDGARDLLRGIDRVTQFNASKNSLEPKISGVKIDLEPHSIKGWETDSKVRETLNIRYLRLLKRARVRTDGLMPLWVDCPVKYFTQVQHMPLLRQTERLTDGITAMVYYNHPDKTVAAAEKVFAAGTGPLEIGIEFSGRAPATDTLYPMDKGAWMKTVEALSGKFMEKSQYMGLSLHDYSALKPILDGSNL